MPEKKYPVAFYDPTRPLSNERGRENPAFAHTPKQEAQFLELGYTDSYLNYPYKSYPRRLYNSVGNSVLSHGVADDADFAAQGYTPTPVRKKEHVAAVGKVAEVAVSESNARVDMLEEQMAIMEAKLEEIQVSEVATKATLQEILDAVKSRGNRKRESGD